jgi:nucleoside phosphorylase
VTRVLVLAAVDVEVRALARRLGLEPVRGAGWPHFRGGVLEVVCVGMGARRLPERAAACRRPTLVVSAGACGALAPDLAEGDLVVPETVLAPDGTRLATAPLAALERRGLLLTVAEVAATATAKARLWVETGARAVDMESAPILAWARAEGVPAAVVRAVSDTAAHGVPADLAGLVAPDGRVSPRRALRVMLSRPGALGDALALRRGTTTALTTVASALARLARAA